MADRHNTEPLPVLLHLHVPKTAGLALNDVILAAYGDPGWTVSDDGHLVKGVYYVHAGIEHRFVPDENARQILSGRDIHAVVGHFSFGIHELVNRPCRYVTLLRHPVDRVVSLYRHIQAWDHESVHEEVIRKNLTLEQFVSDLEFPEVDNGQVRRISGLERAFGKCDQGMLETAIHNMTEHITVAGLTERYVESVLLMKHRLGWPRLPELKKTNVNMRRPEKAPSESACSLIIERNSLDMELYRLAEERLQRQIEQAGRPYLADLVAIGETAVSNSLTTP